MDFLVCPLQITLLLMDLSCGGVEGKSTEVGECLAVN